MYEFASLKPANDRCCVLPCLALAHTCQQLRSEYLPVSCAAAVTIDWKNVPGYLSIHATISGHAPNTKSAPSTVTIYTNVYQERIGGSAVSIDILPFMRMGEKNGEFPFQFELDPIHYDPDGYNEGDSLELEERRRNNAVLKADEKVAMRKIVANTDGKWLSDVRSGKVLEIVVSPLGTSEEPEIAYLSTIPKRPCLKKCRKDIGQLERSPGVIWREWR